MAKSNGTYTGNRGQAMDITFDIQQHLGTLREADGRKWAKEVNLVSWNGAAPKVDIRDWSPDHTRMGKGITLSADEFETLQGLDASQVLEQNQAQPVYDEDLENLVEAEPAM